MTEVTFGYGSDFLATFGWGWSGAGAPPHTHTPVAKATVIVNTIQATVRLVP
jgi:hypothetical protein